MPLVSDLEAGDFRRSLPRFQPGATEANPGLLSVIEDIAGARGATAAQVALAWVLAQGDDIVTIPGAKRIPHLEQNVGAVDLVLDPADRARLEAAFAPKTSPVGTIRRRSKPWRRGDHVPVR